MLLQLNILAINKRCHCSDYRASYATRSVTDNKGKAVYNRENSKCEVNVLCCLEMPACVMSVLTSFRCITSPSCIHLPCPCTEN